jgi:anhydro-N-acetylmuramic acid kinase
MSKIESDGVLGIMSGSSLDGLDFAICNIENSAELRCKLIYSRGFALPHHLKYRLSNFKDLDVEGILTLEVDFTQIVAKGVNEILDLQEYPIDYISFHGHTLIHHPEKGFSFQLGNGGLLAALTGLPVICDFRSTDVGLGGTGAPLAPLVDKYLFSEFDFSLNLGGIANITSIKSDKLIAFDICPCNQILNWLAAFKNLEFDQDGILAASGELNQMLLDDLNKVDYQNLPYPKSLDNEWTQANFRPIITNNDSSLEDKLHTFTIWVSQQVERTIDEIILKEKLSKNTYSCLLAGGGTHNVFLVEALKKQLKPSNVELVVPEMKIIDFKEAMLMSLLGFCRKNNRINTFKDVTGATVDSIGGAIYQGINSKI